MHRRTVMSLSGIHAAVYRATRGGVGTRLVGNDMLLLTTTGRRSGTERSVPLLYLTDGSDYLVAASYGGRPHHPDWYLNLEHRPEAAVQVGARTLEVVASAITPAERTTWWPRFVAAYDGFDRYQHKTHRLIPVVRLSPRT